MLAYLKYTFAPDYDHPVRLILDDGEDEINSLKKELQALMEVRDDFLFVLAWAEDRVTCQQARIKITAQVAAQPGTLRPEPPPTKPKKRTKK